MHYVYGVKTKHNKSCVFVNVVHVAANSANIKCNTAKFIPWSFEAQDTVANCPQITPVHGIMYGGFVRSRLNDQLIDHHSPYMRAARNIALSPFVILLIAIIILIIAYMLSFLVH